MCKYQLNHIHGPPCIYFACRGDGVPPVADGDLPAGALGDRRALPRARRSEDQNTAPLIFLPAFGTVNVFCYFDPSHSKTFR